MVDPIDQTGGMDAANVTAAATYEGFIDAIEDGRIFGWALDVENPEQKLTIDIFHGPTLIGQTLADRYREDLEGYGDGSGRHAFVYNLPKELWAEDSATFYACFEGVNIPLLRGPRCSRLQPIGAVEAGELISDEEQGQDGNWEAVAKRIEACERALVTLVQLAHPGSEYEKGKTAEVRQMGRSVAEMEEALDALEGFAMRNDTRLKALENALEDAAAPPETRWINRLYMFGFYLCALALLAVAGMYFSGWRP